MTHWKHHLSYFMLTNMIQQSCNCKQPLFARTSWWYDVAVEDDFDSDEDDESSRCPGNSWEWGGVGVSIEEPGVGGGGTYRGVGCKGGLWGGSMEEVRCRKINQADTELYCTAATSCIVT